MTTIVITDPVQASAAGEWAVENIGYKHWTLDTVNVLSKNPQYHFKFQHKKHALLFSLKWL